jgi:hypothetical protein
MGSRSLSISINQHFDALRNAFDKVWASLEQDETYRPANVLAERDRLAEIIIDLAQVHRLPASDIPQIATWIMRGRVRTKDEMVGFVTPEVLEASSHPVGNPKREQ